MGQQAGSFNTPEDHAGHKRSNGQEYHSQDDKLRRMRDEAAGLRTEPVHKTNPDHESAKIAKINFGVHPCC